MTVTIPASALTEDIRNTLNIVNNPAGFDIQVDVVYVKTYPNGEKEIHIPKSDLSPTFEFTNDNFESEFAKMTAYLKRND